MLINKKKIKSFKKIQAKKEAEKNELEMHKRWNIPLPRKCPNTRNFESFSLRNPVEFWHRKCMREGCQNEFETSYSPDRRL
jgi:hypothetical protein